VTRRKLDRKKLQDFFDDDPNAKWAIATTIMVAISLGVFFVLDDVLYQPGKSRVETGGTVLRSK
jgi:hypothetical protein